jgi:hypothetical protein
MSLTLFSFSPLIVPDAGGVLVEMRGSFVMGHRHRARIGDTLLPIDPKCYSGIPGQGDILYPLTENTLRAYSPRLRHTAGVAAPYSVLLVDLETLEQGILMNVVEVCRQSYSDATYALRKVLPLHYLTGARDISQEKV